MQAVNQLLENYQLVSTGINKFNPTGTPNLRGKQYDNDHLFEMLSDLCNNQFKAWYCKMFYKLGKDKVLALASIARADAKTDKRRYFSYLLKQA